MNTRRTIQSAIRARINIQVLTVILFGLGVIVVTIVFILGGEDPVSDEGVLTESQQKGARGSITDITRQEEAVAAIEGHRPEKERLESLRATISSGKLEGHVALRGRVIHEDGKAVQGAKVRAILIQTMLKTLRPEDYLSFKTQSTEEGRFEFDRVPMGSYSLLANAGNLGGHTEAFVANPRLHPAAASREHVIVLKPVGSIAGRIVGPDGEPVPGATIMPDPMSACFVRADDQGHFVLINLEVGIYYLQAFAAGLIGWSERGIRIGSTDVEITLAEGGSIRGTVTLDGKPVAGITVTTNNGRFSGRIPVEAVTGKDGRYVLAPLEKSRYSPRVLSNEFTDPERKSINLAKGEHQDHVNFQLKQNGSISGRVTDAETGEPVERIWVCAAPNNYNWYGRFNRYYPGQRNTFVLTDRNGRYELSCCPTVDLTVVTRGGVGYLPALLESGKTIKIAPGERKDDVDFQIQHGPALVVKICTDAGDAVTGAEITLSNRNLQNLSRDECNRAALIPEVIEEAGGRYVFDGISAGIFELEVMKRGWSRIKETVAVTEGEDPLELSIQLSPSITIQGRVVDSAKNGVKDALLKFSNDRYQYRMTGEDGSFIAHDVSTGRRTITVEAEGYLRLSKSIKIEKSSSPLEFIIKPEGTHYIAGVVKNDLGEGLPGVEVRIYQYDGNHRLNKTAETKEDGTFDITGLMESRIQLSVNSDDGHWKDRNQKVDLDRNDLEIILQRYACIKGRVKDASGNPVKQFSVRAKGMGSLGIFSSKPFSNGEFNLDKIQPGEVTLLFSTNEGIEFETEPYTLAPGEIREGVSITLMEMGTLTGIIKEKATSKPVSGVSIIIQETGNDRFSMMFMGHRPSNATTGEDGAFVIEKQKPGIFDVYARHSDYAETCLKQVEVLSGATTGPVVILLQRGGVIRGHVFVDGQGKTGIEVEANRQNPYQNFSTITGAEGRYEIKGLSQTKYKISASMRNDSMRGQISRTIKAQAGVIVDCDLIFRQGSSIEGTVYLLGKPTGGVSISVSSARGSDQNSEAQLTRSMWNESEQDGSYRIEGLEPGKYRIWANHREAKRSFSFQKVIEVRPGVNVIDIRIGKEGSCEVFGFVYENDAPAANVQVTVSAGGAQSRVPSDSNGAFRFSNLPAGKASLNSSLRKGNSRNNFQIRKQLELKEGESIREDLHFATGSSVLFGDIRENGTPVTGVFVRIESDAADGSGKVSMSSFRPFDGDGGYRFEFLPAGRYVLQLLLPFRIRQEVILKAAEELRVDFDYATGNGSIQGTVNAPGDDKESGIVDVYLFKPGTCPWQEGKTFQDLSFDEGLMFTLWVDQGSFNQDKLPADTFDVVAVRHKEKKVLRLDIQRITLADGESKTVNLNVLEE